MPEQAGQTLSHYRLVEKIGEGGMGVVWQAEDTVLGRTVAIKVLPAEAARDEERRKMLFEEAKLASSVGGAQIVQVFEFGREGDLDFIVMEHVEGSPLSKILHGRPLPPDKIANLASQIAQGLSKAHRKGLLHRDLKPANILVTPEGDARILDFGLASLFRQADPDPESQLETRTSMGPVTDSRIAGTIPYMSPEQVRGETLDARSDIFSLGIILYEMTTGRRPFSGASGPDVADEIRKARPRPVHEIVRDVPLDLHRIIEKALAPRPGERYQTMEDLAVDLRRLGRDLESGSSRSFQELESRAVAGTRRRNRFVMAAAAAAVAVIAAVAVFSSGVMTPPPGAGTLLVLPMQVRGQSQGADYVGQAFSEALAVHLAQMEGLTVLPVPGAGPPVEARRREPGLVASEDGAGRMLTGAITRRGDRVQASLSLVSTTENRILWGTDGEAPEEDLTRLASTLARKAAGALGLAPPKRYDALLNQTGGPEMAASPLTAQALGAIRRNEIDEALRTTSELVRNYPGDPAAHVLHAAALARQWMMGGDPSALADLEATLAALERLDPDHPHVMMGRALIHAFRRGGEGGEHVPRTFAGEGGNARDAVRLLTRLLDRNDLTPALRVEILSRRAWPLRNLGDMEGAVSDLEEALELEPTNAKLLSDLGVMLHEMGQTREAVLRSRHAVALEPSNWTYYHQLSRALKGAGDIQEAVEASQKACDMSNAQQACASHAGNLLLAGRKEEAREAARRARELPDTIAGVYNLACYWALSGDRDRALDDFRKVVSMGGGAMWVARDPDLAILHGDPEFEALIEEMKEQIGAQGPAGVEGGDLQ